MNTDSHFEIGNSHIICEDYAIAGIGVKEGVSYAIVCDGCSSSTSVDLGARVLAYSALKTLLSMGGGSQEGGYEDFGKTTICNAEGVFELLPNLHEQALDATLLVAAVADSALTLYMYGDGVAYIKFNNGQSRLIHVSFPSGAPAYLSYYLDEGRMKAYKNMSDKKIVTEIVVGADNTIKRTTTETDPFSPVLIQGNFITQGDSVSVISDGINSFRKGDNEEIPWEGLIGEFAEYKNTTGVFVHRRISAFKRKCQKENIRFYDDISVASIVV